MRRFGLATLLALLAGCHSVLGIEDIDYAEGDGAPPELDASSNDGAVFDAAPPDAVASDADNRPTGVLNGDLDISNTLEAHFYELIEEITGELTIVPNVAIGTISLPNLTQIGTGAGLVADHQIGQPSIHGSMSFSAPALAMVHGDLVLANLLSFDTALVEVTGMLAIESHDAPNTDGFATLETVGAIFGIGASSTPNMTFASLETVGNNLQVGTSNGLVTLSFPSLTSVGGSFNISGNPNLESINAPLLANLPNTETFFVVDNPKLPTCQVSALLAQLDANGFAGTVVVSGNDDAATCP